MNDLQNSRWVGMSVIVLNRKIIGAMLNGAGNER
jgi:hypothetical protein